MYNFQRVCCRTGRPSCDHRIRPKQGLGILQHCGSSNWDPWGCATQRQQHSLFRRLGHWGLSCFLALGRPVNIPVQAAVRLAVVWHWSHARTRRACCPSKCGRVPASRHVGAWLHVPSAVHGAHTSLTTRHWGQYGAVGQLRFRSGGAPFVALNDMHQV